VEKIGNFGIFMRNFPEHRAENQWYQEIKITYLVSLIGLFGNLTLQICQELHLWYLSQPSKIKANFFYVYF